MNQLLCNFRHAVNILPEDPGSIKASAQTVHVALHIEEVPAVPSYYLIHTVAKEKTPVVRTDHSLIAGNNLSVQIYSFHFIQNFNFPSSSNWLSVSPSGSIPAERHKKYTEADFVMISIRSKVSEGVLPMAVSYTHL